MSLKPILRALFMSFALLAAAGLAHADQMPLSSGVIAIATEPVSIKTVSLQGNIIGRTAGVGQPIYLNDEIKTGPQNRLQILLKDQSVFNIGPNSQLTIDKFVYDPTKPELSVNIQKGAFKFVSGKIASGNPDSMKVKLPNATIAVRGTGVAGDVAPDGASTVVLLHGTVDVTSTASGTQGSSSTATLSKSGWGVQVGSAGNVSAPALLPADTVNGILQKVGRATVPAALQAQNNPQASGGGAVSSVSSVSTTDSSNVASSSSGLTAAQLASARMALATAPAALTASQTELLQQSQVLALSPCGSCALPGDPPIALYNYFTLNSLQNANAASLGPLGTITFVNNGISSGRLGDVVTLNQTLAVNYQGATLTNTYNFVYNYVTQIMGPGGPILFRTNPYNYCTGGSCAGSYSSTFANLASSGADPHTFVLPTNPAQTNIQMTATLGSPVSGGVAGSVANLGYVINPGPNSATLSGVTRVFGH